MIVISFVGKYLVDLSVNLGAYLFLLLGSSVGSTFDEVCRVLVKTNVPDTEATHLSCGGEPDRKLGPLTAGESSAFHEEGDKKLLKDLLDLRNFGLASARPASSEVKVRQVYGSKYKDSDSSDDDLTDRVDSPSTGIESAYQRRSNPIRNSLHRTNASSANCATGDGVSPNRSFHDDASHFPAHGPFAEPLDRNPRRCEPTGERCTTDGALQTLCEEYLADDSADAAMVSASSSSDTDVADGSCVTSIDVSELQRHCKSGIPSLRFGLTCLYRGFDWVSCLYVTAVSFVVLRVFLFVPSRQLSDRDMFWELVLLYL